MSALKEKEVDAIFRRALAIPLAAMLAFAGCMAGVTVITGYGVTYNAAAGDTPTENITEMIEDLVPSFVLLIFVMVFMLMLLTIVDRVGKH